MRDHMQFNDHSFLLPALSYSDQCANSTSPPSLQRWGIWTNFMAPGPLTLYGDVPLPGRDVPLPGRNVHFSCVKQLPWAEGMWNNRTRRLASGATNVSTWNAGHKWIKRIHSWCLLEQWAQFKHESSICIQKRSFPMLHPTTWGPRSRLS